jgi:hypothetical protein
VATPVSHFMHDVRDRGIRAVVANAVDEVGSGPVFLTVVAERVVRETLTGVALRVRQPALAA